MKKVDALNVIIKSARLYKKNLLNKNYLIVYKNKDSYEYIETVFINRNFRHLTGVKTELNANHFYQKSIKHKLTERDFNYKYDGTTILKLRVLAQVMQLHKISKIVGLFNNNGSNLKTDMLVGNDKCSMGFRLDKEIGYYIPNTVINGNVSDYITEEYEVVAVYSKDKREINYTEQLKCSHDINEFGEEILDKIAVKVY